MPWRPITPADIVSRMTQSEQAMLTNASGAASALQARLSDAITTFDSAMLAVGNPILPPPNMVDRFRVPVCDYAVWTWLTNFPALKAFATDARRDSFKEAQSLIDKIANRQCGAIESPAGYATTANWNSWPQIQMRMAQIPPPLAQFPNVGNPYPTVANSNATSVVPELTIPDPPKNVWVSKANPGQLIINWVPPTNAYFYNIMRGLTSGSEVQYAAVGNVATFTDAAVTPGQAYYYVVIAGNTIGNSLASNEATAIAPPA